MLSGMHVKGMSVRLALGPNSIFSREETFGAPCPSTAPTESGWTGSVKATRMVVRGSTLRSPPPGMISGEFCGGGLEMTSGPSSSSPTVVQASTRASSARPSVLRSAVVTSMRIWTPVGKRS